MSAPRGLTAEEAAAWARLAASVTPLEGRAPPKAGETRSDPALPAKPRAARDAKAKGHPGAPTSALPPRAPAPGGGLDSHWERRIGAGRVLPDVTIDLHGLSLDEAHRRLDRSIGMAREIGARVVLVIAGRPRGGPSADRANRRGAIRAMLLDWIAAGPHAGAIAAVRKAHPRHGGEGALYLILRRR